MSLKGNLEWTGKSVPIVEIVIDEAKKKGYYFEHGSLWQPRYVGYVTMPDDDETYFTHTYECVGNLRTFVPKCLLSKPDFADYWIHYHELAKTRKLLHQFIEQHLPKAKPPTSAWYAFRNGIYDASCDAFYEYGSEEWESIDFDHRAVKYFDQRFIKTRTDRVRKEDFPTFLKLLATQGYHDALVDMLLACLGNLICHGTMRNGGWRAPVVIRGAPSSGKSVFSALVACFFEEDDLEYDIEGSWRSYQNGSRKLLMVQEVRPRHTKLFKSITEEKCPLAFGTALMSKGKNIPDGAIVFDFPRTVTKVDPEMFRKIEEEELPFILQAAAKAFREYVPMYHVNGMRSMVKEYMGRLGDGDVAFFRTYCEKVRGKLSSGNAAPLRWDTFLEDFHQAAEKDGIPWQGLQDLQMKKVMKEAGLYRIGDICTVNYVCLNREAVRNIDASAELPNRKTEKRTRPADEVSPVRLSRRARKLSSERSLSSDSYVTDEDTTDDGGESAEILSGGHDI